MHGTFIKIIVIQVSIFIFVHFLQFTSKLLTSLVV